MVVALVTDILVQARRQLIVHDVQFVRQRRDLREFLRDRRGVVLSRTRGVSPVTAENLEFRALGFIMTGGGASRSAGARRAVIPEALERGEQYAL